MAKQEVKTKKKRQRLVLLDTHAILHRAYHALPELSSSKGEPTGALFGLVSMLLKAIQELKPDYLVAARDLPGKTKRHDAFAEYKATRPKTEEALIAQLARAPEVFKAFGIPVYAHEGYEADDVAGTIVARLAPQNDLETVIVTGDVDLLQLVSDKKSVEAYRLLTGITNTKFYDEAAVVERYGFPPRYIADMKGIMGDQSDNIKGVPGVGEKGARGLIRAFGGLDDIYEAIRKFGVGAAAKKAGVRERYVQLVADNEESARFSKALASIHTDIPLDFTVPAERWRIAEHLESILRLCDELEFRALKARVRAAAGAQGEEGAAGRLGRPAPPPVAPAELKETSIALWLLHSDITNPSLDDIMRFAKADDFAVARQNIFKQLRDTGRLQEVYDKIENPLIPVVERMNAAGVFLDTKYFGTLQKEYAKALGGIAGRIYQAAGHEFNINSPKQLAGVLYDELKLGESARHKRTAGGARTTREEELVKLAHEHAIVADVLEYRELQKLLGTYIEKLPALVGGLGRLRAEFVQAGTTTGRMSSQNPNLQNIPISSERGRRIRAGFAAPPGRLIAAFDYSQIELRIAAGLAGDQKLIGVFRKGEDVHAAVASEVFNVPLDKVDKEMRRRAKVINFGILYGMGAGALKENLGTVSREEASRYLEEYFAEYAGLARFVEKTKQDAARRGFTETLFGRRRYFAGFRSPLPQMRAAAERMAINAPIQGTQADIIKLAMVEADALIERQGWRGKATLVMQVHDELVYELDERDAEEIARAICGAMEGVVGPERLHGVPIVAEIALGPNWGETKRLPRV